MGKIKVEYIAGALVIRNVEGKFFKAFDDTIIISIPNLIILLNYLLKNNIISPKVIEGLLEEYHSN